MLPSLPLLDPGTSATCGLDILAAAADADMNRQKPIQASLSLLLQPGLFNPAASLSMKVVQKILDLKFVETLEVTIDDMLPAVPGRPHHQLSFPSLIYMYLSGSNASLSWWQCSAPSSPTRWVSCLPIRLPLCVQNTTMRGRDG